jgi:hypothetical protein
MGNRIAGQNSTNAVPAKAAQRTEAEESRRLKAVWHRGQHAEWPGSTAGTEKIRPQVWQGWGIVKQ